LEDHPFNFKDVVSKKKVVDYMIQRVSLQVYMRT